MTEKFQEELAGLRKDLMEMGGLAVWMLRTGMKALKEHDSTLAGNVVAGKTDLARMDLAIEDKALRLIALFQPVASDLRLIACVLKMETYLNRVGRYGKDIAAVAVELGGRPHLGKLVSLPYMTDVAAGMVESAIRAFETGDLKLLEGFSNQDDELDSMRWSIFRECVTYMMEDPKNITICAHYIMIARYLERVADHACKMAEKIHYMVTGEHIEIR